MAVQWRWWVDIWGCLVTMLHKHMAVRDVGRDLDAAHCACPGAVLPWGGCVGFMQRPSGGGGSTNVVRCAALYCSARVYCARTGGLGSAEQQPPTAVVF